jgi:ribulose-phosphate 3-epimerase
MVKISASIVSGDLANLQATLRALEEGGADMVHFDIEDGSFVPAMNLGTRIIETARPLTRLPLDVHLMMNHPEWIIPELAAYGVNRVSVHYEASPYPRRILGLIAGHGIRAGLAFNAATALPPLQFCLPFLSFVLILTTEPEAGGWGSLLPSALARVAEGKAQPGLEGVEWAVDGGITPENAAEVCRAGTDSIVAGRSVFRDGVIQENILRLKKSCLTCV